MRNRLDVAEGWLTPLVGRRTELGVLLDCWERVRDGTGQAVLVRADAGIGKSRLVASLCERFVGQPHRSLKSLCSPYTRDTAFQPVIDLLGQGLGFVAEDTPAEKLGKRLASHHLSVSGIKERCMPQLNKDCLPLK